MVRVKIESGFDPASVSVGAGSVWYLVNGVWVLRSGQGVVDPRSASQLNERAGFAHGSRQWAYDLSTATKDAWDADTASGTGGFQKSMANSSCLWQTGLVPDPLSAPGPLPVCGVLPQPVFVPGTETLTWNLTFPDAEMDSEVWISAALVMRAGGTRELTQSRIVFTGPATNGVKNLWNGVVEQFGNLVTSAEEVLVWQRYSVPSKAKCPPPCKPGQNCVTGCSVTPSVFSIPALSSQAVDCYYSETSDPDPLVGWTAKMSDETQFVIEGTESPQCGIAGRNIQDVSGIPGVFGANVIFTLTDNSATCSAGVTITVQGIPPP